jgi:hypothetical protein
MSKLIFIVSLPRSGSTILTTLLDGYDSFVCLPESGFPQVLDYLGPDALKDSSRAAKLFLASCFGGSLLSLSEAEACIVSDPKETLVQLGMATSRKLERDPGTISFVVWKTTRLISRWHSLAGMGGRFVILQRELLNVYESQFRVHFGLYNRNPWRFALFSRSYEKAFDGYPTASVFHMNYASMDNQIPGLLTWLGAENKVRTAGASALETVRQSFDFHSNILSGFQNNDEQKILTMPARTRTAMLRSYRMVKLADPVVHFLRRWADRRVLKDILQRADNNHPTLR